MRPFLFLRLQTVSNSKNIATWKQIIMARNSAEAAYDEIKRQILAGTLRPAERLVESTLAENLQASRHNIRAALDRLQNDGLVEIEANKGARVRSLTLEEVLDMYVAREGLEAEVVRLATMHITDEQLEELRDCLQAMKEAFASSKFDQYSNLNRQFHKVIYAASGNHTLPELISQIILQLARLNMRVILLPGRRDTSLYEHSAIYEAIAQRDTERAVQAIRQHISGVRTDIENGWEIVRI